MSRSRRLAIVIGLGEIGKPIYEMLDRVYNILMLADGPMVVGRDVKKTPWDCDFDFMHVCYPQSPNFIESLKDYVDEYHPKYIIIHSTLSPGMTRYLYGLRKTWDNFHLRIFYSPVRGNIRDGMDWCLRRYTKYVGGMLSYLEEEYEPVLLHLAKAGFNPRWVGDSTALEWAKILDLAWYGLNIAFYQELERIVDTPESYNIVHEFIESTPVESEGKAERTIFYGGHIGGHCVMQAIEKTLGLYDIPMLRAVIDSNIKREKELMFSRPSHHPKPAVFGQSA